MAGIDVAASALSGSNAAYVADLHARWVGDRRSVDPSFSELFEALGEDAHTVLTDATGASWAPRQVDVADGVAPPAPVAAQTMVMASIEEEVRARALDSIRALMLIRTYRVRGHLQAKLDPLGLQVSKVHPELDPQTYGFSESDFDRPIFINGVLGRQTASLRTILSLLADSYCGSIGVEFMHIQDPDQKAWIQKEIEGSTWRASVEPDLRRKVLQQLTEAEGFETFCQKRFVGTKRFGLEGGEVTIPALHAILDVAADDGVIEVAIGMPHRGRLNTLVNVMRKPFEAMFSEFGGASSQPKDIQGSGDVKYHLGTSTDIELTGRQLHLSLQPNPSHLEAVDPVVIGKIRARQDIYHDDKRRKAMAILMHGDAAFAGQGLVYETLAMSQLIGYRVGGTIHVVVNNQIGFTTIPAHAYSGLYCTDVAKSIQSPILHVNGDDPDAVVFCAKLCAKYREKFGADVVLDIVCYRRHGHNETDEPAFTQPVMYNAIKHRPTVRQLYAEQLIADKVLLAEEAGAMVDGFNKTLEEAYQSANSYRPNRADWLEGRWAGLKQAGQEEERAEEKTSITKVQFEDIGNAISSPPPHFDLNAKIARQLQAKRQMVDGKQPIDWATGEALAFGGLLVEGHRVRLSGEDCQRGTFSQRHAVLIDQSNQNEYVPLNNIRPDQAKIEIYNSLLSEAGVLGFEYGYTLADPQTLVLWEAQFGDFANGAQVIIDQFLASGETKWLRMSGLTLLLPHGYEGQGPEHSSARLERYLQLCAERNMVVANLTTPANYFHALRRQLKRNFRKPLVVMTPKSLLRNKMATSCVEDFLDGSCFQPVLQETDPAVDPKRVRRVVLCSGKVYYDLIAERSDRAVADVAILRIEQLYPFPADKLAAAVSPYVAAEIVWCQEEPENMGAWRFLDRRLEAVLATLDGPARRPIYVGRVEAASTATGLARVHASEQSALVSRALTIG